MINFYNFYFRIIKSSFIFFCNILTHVDPKTFLINRKRVISHHDNTCPHIALLTKDLEGFGVEVLPHPAYFPDLAPLHYRSI